MHRSSQLFRSATFALFFYVGQSTAVVADVPQSQALSFMAGMNLALKVSDDCDPVDEIADIEGVANLIRGDFGKSLGMHSGKDGLVSELFVTDPRKAGAAWAISMIELSEHCGIPELFLSQRAELVRQIINKMTE